MDCSAAFSSALSELSKEQQHAECTNYLRKTSSADKVLLYKALSFKYIYDNNLHTQEGFQAGPEGFKQWCMEHQGTYFGSSPYNGNAMNRDPERLLAMCDPLVAAHNDRTIINKPTGIGQLSAIYSRGAWAGWLDVVMQGSESFMEQGFTSPEKLWGDVQLRTIATADKLFQQRVTVVKWDISNGCMVPHKSRKLNQHHFTNAAHIVKLEIELEAGLVVSLLGKGVVECICCHMQCSHDINANHNM